LCFINALLNIILHLRNPTIFYLEKQPNYNCEVKPDSGSVILMCVEILTYIVGNDSFQMEPCHVSHCLHIPLALFSGFHKLKVSLVSYKTSTLFDNQKVEPSGDTCRDIADHKFSVELYASCCRLLYTTVKHQKRYAYFFLCIQYYLTSKYALFSSRFSSDCCSDVLLMLVLVHCTW